MNIFRHRGSCKNLWILLIVIKKKTTEIWNCFTGKHCLSLTRRHSPFSQSAHFNGGKSILSLPLSSNSLSKCSRILPAGLPYIPNAATSQFPSSSSFPSFYRPFQLRRWGRREKRGERGPKRIIEEEEGGEKAGNGGRIRQSLEFKIGETKGNTLYL